jgi:hypothetical protein
MLALPNFRSRILVRVSKAIHGVFGVVGRVGIGHKQLGTLKTEIPDAIFMEVS